MTRHTTLALALVAAAGLSRGVYAETSAKEPGDLWELKTQMSMSGPHTMSMPEQTQQSCRPRNQEWNEPPASKGNDQCKMTGWSRSGNTASWKVECAGGISGTGEMTFEGNESYSGTMTMQAPQGSMVMNMKGRRIGDCDYADTRKQRDEIKATADRAQAQSQASQKQQAEAAAEMCTNAAKQGNTTMILGPTAPCKDPKNLELFCASLATPAGYAFSSKPGMPPGQTIADAAKACGKDAGSLKSQACGIAEQTYAGSFLKENCPDQALALAQKNCAGRRYTTIDDPTVRNFCVYYASEILGQGDSGQPAEKEGAAKKGKKLLKGLLGR